MDGKCSHIFVTYKIGFDANIHHFCCCSSIDHTERGLNAWARLLMFDKEEEEMYK